MRLNILEPYSAIFPCLHHGFLYTSGIVSARPQLTPQTQTCTTIGQNNLFKDIGYGATDALGGIPHNPNAGVRNVYGGSAPGPSPGLQSQNYVYRAEPWSPIASSQAYATYPSPPYPNAQRTSTQSKYCNVWGELDHF
jgi:hypothetical protein